VGVVKKKREETSTIRNKQRQTRNRGVGFAASVRLGERPMAAVAKVAKTFGRSHSVPKLLASFATGIFSLTARLNQRT
jgi:hypothetical protein